MGRGGALSDYELAEAAELAASLSVGEALDERWRSDAPQPPDGVLPPEGAEHGVDEPEPELAGVTDRDLRRLLDEELLATDAVDEPSDAAGWLRRVVDLHDVRARAHAEVLAAVSALRRLTTGQRATLRDDGASRPARGTVHPGVVDELAAALRISGYAAERLVTDADQVGRCLPRTFEALSGGWITDAHVRKVVDATAHLTEDEALAVDDEIHPQSYEMTPGELGDLLETEVAGAGGAAARRREALATADRSVVTRRLRNGQAQLVATGPVADVEALRSAVASVALDRTRPGARVDPHAAIVHPDRPDSDERNLAAREFDALRELADAVLAGAPGLGTGRGPQLLVAMTTLLGLDDDPARLVPGGPVSARVARQLAQHHPLRRVLTDPFSGQVVAVDGHTHPPGSVPPPGPPGGSDDPGGGGPGGGGPGSSPSPPRDPAPHHHTSGRRSTCPVAAAGGGEYRIPPGVARFTRARTTRCCGPGCRLPSARCDLDHVRRWPEGPTCPCNLVPLCRTHHGMKHERGWRVRWVGDDARDLTLVWTSPLGQVLQTRPEPFLRRSGAGRHLAAARRRGRRAGLEPPLEDPSASYAPEPGDPPF